MSAQTEIRIGSEFVGYRIDELIGRGGMGVVYRAYDLRLKRTVALKLMAPELALDQRFRERFSREAELAMSLEHPNVVPIHDAGDIDGRLYLAMRHVEGTDLRALLHAEGALDPARALAICSQVANALDAAHAKGLVHRDVKPSNVLLDANEHVYLADFGLTRRLDEQGGPAGEGRSVGTPAYLAPEQIEGGPVDGRTDVYSLGCLLYECLTGETPFARGSRLAVAWAHLEEEPPSASERRPELPEAIDAVIRKAMAKEPEDRYTTCAALIAAAEEALGLRRPPALLRRRRTVARCPCDPPRPRRGARGRRARSRRRQRWRGRAGRQGRHARPHRPCDEHGQRRHRRRPETLRDRRRRTQRLGLQRCRPVDLGDRRRQQAVVRHTTTLVAAPSVIRMPSRGRCWPPTRAGAWLVGVDERGRSYLTRVFSGPRGKREYRLEDEPRAVAVGYGAVWVVVRGARDNQVLRIDPATGERHEADALPQLLADRRSRRRPWQRLGRGLVHRNALPDQPSLGTRDGTDRPRRTRRPTRGGARLDLGRLVRAREVTRSSSTLGRSASSRHLGCCPPERGYDTARARLDLDLRHADRDRRAVGRSDPSRPPPTSMSRIRRSTAGSA